MLSRPRWRSLSAVVLAAGVAAALLAAPASTAAPRPAAAQIATADRATTGGELPTVSPMPQQISRAGRDIAVPGWVEVVVGDATDAAAQKLLVQALRAHGVERVEVTHKRGNAPLGVLLGPAGRADIRSGLADTDVPEHPEGYALRVDHDGAGPLGQVALGGTDAAGQYYAVQTLRQLFEPTEDGWRLAGASMSDYPSMPLRGTIEGFYGEPWSHAERLDQLRFYGDVKANTYIYAPKDDPYHRERWREPYPADKLAQLAELVDVASAHHVRFTFALSPGNTVCYSSEQDYQALTTKLQEMYDVGVRAFSIPLDDIAYGQWNCEADRETFGPPSAGAAGEAQAQLLDRIQREWIETHEGAKPLQMVPTEYYNTVDSPYKAALRTMDEDIVVMWTGEGVVPSSVTIEQAEAAAEVFGGPPFLWDNYPVNDYGNTAGRLLLAPYAKRERGLSDHLAGIVSNPMNQAAASKVAIFGFADFTWNDRAYDPDRNWREAMRYLAGDDSAATEALLVFGDLNHMAPTFGAQPWQPQAPELASRIDAFWSAWKAGDQRSALASLRGYADRIAGAPEVIRGGAVGDAFVSDAAPWLDATNLWGASMQRMLDALEAGLDGDRSRAEQLAAESADLMAQAEEVRVDPPDNRWGRARVRIADGVLDTFLVAAAEVVENPLVADVPAKVVYGEDGSATLPIEVRNRLAGPVEDVTLEAALADGTVSPNRVELDAMDNGDAETTELGLSWPSAGARKADLTTTLSWSSADGGAQTAESSAPVQVTCAAEPTTPEAVTFADSEETAGEDGAAANAIDGDPGTIWHTAWSTGNPPHPHEIQFDLGSQRDVCGLRYLPRQTGSNGRVADYEIYLSDDGETWGEPVTSGRFSDTAAEQWAPILETSARYVRFVALSEVNGNPWASAAEISVDAR